MRILVTNDDGIDSIGLHVLARSMQQIGEVVVVAPDDEYSGSSAAFGSLLTMKPEVQKRSVDGIGEAWAVTGPPALCVMFARLGIVGGYDMVVAGINPGANVGRSIYHSGTVGACTTARNGGVNAVAVSQAVTDVGVEGQGWEAMLDQQVWEGAADCAQVVVQAIAADLPAEPVVANLNVPNCKAADMRGWKRTVVGTKPPRTMSTATLVPKKGHDGAFHVEMAWGEAADLPEDTDGGAVMAGYASLSWLGPMTETEPTAAAAFEAEGALGDFLG